MFNILSKCHHENWTFLKFLSKNVWNMICYGVSNHQKCKITSKKDIIEGSLSFVTHLMARTLCNINIFCHQSQLTNFAPIHRLTNLLTFWFLGSLTFLPGYLLTLCVNDLTALFLGYIFAFQPVRCSTYLRLRVTLKGATFFFWYLKI